MRSRGQIKSRRQEDRAAEDLDGYVQKASGAGDFAKSDVRKVQERRAECKTTGKKSFTLKLSDIQKIQLEALEGGLEDWVFQVEFQGQVGQNKKLAIIDWYRYLELLESEKVAQDE